MDGKFEVFLNAFCNLSAVVDGSCVLMKVLVVALVVCHFACDSVLGGVISATTLIVVNWIVSCTTYRSKRIARLVEERPRILIHIGHIHPEVMARKKLTHSELDAAPRIAGCASVSDVHSAVVEIPARSAFD